MPLLTTSRLSLFTIMKKLLLLSILLLPALCFAQNVNKETKMFDLLIGTFTGTSPTSSKGIYVYRFYEETGTVSYLSEIALKNPAYMGITTDHKYIYSVNENNNDGPSGVTALKFDKTSGKLAILNTQPSIGSPAYIAVDQAQKNVLIANYLGGSAMVFPIKKDGSLGASTQTLQDTGKGPNPQRQAGPHAHTIVFSPDEKQVLFTDLGTDRINVFNYHASETPPLAPAATPFIAVTPGSGPRHIDFSPNGRFMYNIQEISASITAFTYHNGHAKEIQHLNMMSDDFKGVNSAADLHVSPDGLFLYATNRGTANQLLLYAIDQQNGKLTYIERYPTGEMPRNFVIDPTGNFLLVGNAKGVIIFQVAKATGKLTLTSNAIKMESPVCLKMIPVE
jgi:6-phosphogluconolactonase